MDRAEKVGGTHKALVLSNLYHSTPRIPALCKYLPAHGWEPTIITPRIDASGKTHVALPTRDLGRLRIVQVGEETTYEERKGRSGAHGVVRILNDAVDKINPSPDSDIKAMVERNYWRAYTIKNFPDPERGWEAPLTEAARKLLRDERFDAILSSSSPVITHIAAGKLREEFGLPWVADLRDLWSQNHNLPMGKVLRAMTSNLERTTLAKASALVTVSPTWADDLRSLHRRDKVYCITNGFDPEDVVEVKARPGKFTITYTGQVYPGKQDPGLTIIAIMMLLYEGNVRRDEFELRFYGPRNETVDGLASELGLGGIVNQYGPVTRMASLERQWESHLLLLMDWDDRTQPGVIPLKFFEYLHTRNPMLVTGGNKAGVVAQMVRDTGCGKNTRTVDETAEAIGAFLAKFREGSWSREIACDTAKSSKFAFPSLAGDYAVVLDSVL
ncbi:MAG: glycosyltransferase [Methanomassiliicoccales archaeon]|nr:glycosyltransferase [Methanomassiliicoccales archaeon]